VESLTVHDWLLYALLALALFLAGALGSRASAALFKVALRLYEAYTQRRRGP